MTAVADDEMTELLDADFPRVDLVGKGANGIPRFLIAKQAADSRGLVPPDLVRELIGKQSEPESGRERVEMPSGVTLTGSPADIAAFIHKAAQRAAEPDDVAKAKLSSAELNDLPDSAFAYIEPGGKKDGEGKTTPRSLRHFAIHDKSHADNAAARIAQGAKFGDKAKPKVEAAQRKFGEKVSKEAGVTAGTVTKDAMGPELDDGIDGMDPTVPLAAPEDDAPGDPADPGSPAWEAIDAATARKWTSIAVRLKNALCILSERELLEAASADPDDAENAWDLQDAQCALDYVIDVLAGFAVSEQAEADLCGEAMEAIGKALAGFDPAPIGVIEGMSAIRKAGRVLSTANETLIREAAANLNSVLSSLPKAPVTDDGQPVAKSKETTVDATQTPAAAAKDAATVAKETASAGTQTAGTGESSPGDVTGREVLKAALLGIYDQSGTLTGVADPAAVLQRVAKADDGSDAKTTMQAVFDENGNLVGIVDPADITPVAGAGGKPDADDGDGSDAADSADMTPQPPADAGTPADAVAGDGTVAKASPESGQAAVPDAQDVLKSVTEAIRAAFETQSASSEETVAKQAAVIAELTGNIEVLKARVEEIAETPAAPKVFTNGQVPPQHQLRGQDQGAARQVDVAKAAEMRARFRDADPVEQNRLADEMQQAAIGHLAVLHGRG